MKATWRLSSSAVTTDVGEKGAPVLGGGTGAGVVGAPVQEVASAKQYSPLGHSESAPLGHGVAHLESASYQAVPQ